MARLRVPGDTASERAQVLMQSIQEVLASNNTNTSVNLGSTSVGGIVQDVESAIGSWLFPSRNPRSIRQVLLQFLNQPVTIVTPFDTVSGTLIAVKLDYVVLVNGAGNLILVPINKVESVSSP